MKTIILNNVLDTSKYIVCLMKMRPDLFVEANKISEKEYHIILNSDIENNMHDSIIKAINITKE